MNTEVFSSKILSKANTREALLSGVLSGVTGLLVFLVIHALWIVPIWFILPVGLVIAGLGGLAVGLAYAELQHRLPPRPWTVPFFILLIVIILLPATLLAELRTPMFAFTPTGPLFQMDLFNAVLIFIAELLLSAALTGGLLGLWIGRTPRAAFLMAMAGFIFALGPGHNIPFIGGTGGVFKEWAIMGSIIITSVFVLVEGQAWITARRAVD